MTTDMRLHSRRFVIAALAAGLACAPAESGDDATPAAGNPEGLRGNVMPAPLDKPAVILTDTHGRAFDLRRETDGYLTLLYFGYTFCPDVCPIQMANLGAVIKELRPSVSERIRVVFVTTDPERDTPERLGTWLGNFHASFIGLTGDSATINAVQQALQLPLPQLGPADSTGSYEVGHAAAVIAFMPGDNKARVRYPFGIRQADWAHDLPKLLEMTWPGP
jgi:protein SCO1/2